MCWKTRCVVLGLLRVLAIVGVLAASRTTARGQAASQPSPAPLRELNIVDVGALPGDQTLVEVKNKVGSGLEWTVTQQTATGVAIQSAIDAVGAAGGGVVLIPSGTWYVYSYLQVKHPNVEIRGQGDSSILKAMPNAPCAHGYGILVLGFGGKGQPAGGFTGLVVRDLKFDGNIYARGKPDAEYQMYNLAVYGDIVQAEINSVTSVDSGIDCLMLAYGNNDNSSVTVTNSLFRGAFRNTASFCAGNNIKVQNCFFEDAGAPFGGTNPRYCLDIEPNHPEGVMRNIRIANCTFRNPINAAAGVVWAKDVVFDGCTFAAGKNTVQGILFHTAYSDVTANYCTFDGRAFDGCYIRQMAAYERTKELGLQNRLVLNGNHFERVGGEIQGQTAVIRNNVFLNSPKALFVMAPFAVVDSNLMINCGWADPNGGRCASLCVGYNSDAQRRYVVSNNLVRFNEDYLDVPLDRITAAQYYGIYIQYINAEVQLIGNRAEGFYRFPELKGEKQNPNHYRDWASPNLPPEDKRTETNVTWGNTQGGPQWRKETTFK